MSFGAQDTCLPKAGGLCVMQALNFCTHDGRTMTGNDERILADRHSRVPGPLRSALIVMNDEGDDEDRKWLLSLLPKIAEVLPNVNEKMTGIPWDNILGIHTGVRDLNGISKVLVSVLGVDEQRRNGDRVSRLSKTMTGSMMLHYPVESISHAAVKVWFEKNVEISFKKAVEVAVEVAIDEAFKSVKELNTNLVKVQEKEEELCQVS